MAAEEIDEKPEKDLDYFSLSDEDFEKEAVPEEDSSENQDTSETTASIEDTESEEEPEQESTDPGEESEPVEGESEAETVDENTKESDKGNDPEKPDTEESVDYKAQYERLMAPFQANGKEITPKNPEDAVRLMQMGANYHKKMAGMKPAMKALKTLENNGLLEDGKLDFLIDIHNGNSEAITKLIKDQKIDPMEVDTEADSTYQPTNHSASDAEIELDSVLESIQESPSYSKTLTAVTKEWDQDSRSQVAFNPQIISVINQHMDTGVYDKVMDAVNYDRSIGKLAGVSDFEAYKLTGNRLEQEGAFNTSVTSSQKAEVKEPAPQTDPKVEQKRKAQKKAASPTKTTTKKVSKLPSDFNPLDLSEEEFNKFDPKKLGI